MEKRYQVPIGTSYWIYTTPIRERHKAARSGSTEKVTEYSESEDITEVWLNRFADSGELQTKRERYVAFSLPDNVMGYTFIVFHREAVTTI